MEYRFISSWKTLKDSSLKQSFNILVRIQVSNYIDMKVQVIHAVSINRIHSLENYDVNEIQFVSECLEVRDSFQFVRILDYYFGVYLM